MLDCTPNRALSGITDHELTILRMLLEKVSDAYETGEQTFKAREVGKVLRELISEACARDDANAFGIRRVAA